MTWVIQNKNTGLFYAGKYWKWGGTPKIYAKIGWAKSALTGLQKHTWNKEFQACEIVVFHSNKFADVNIYEADCVEYSAIFVNGESKGVYGDRVTARDLYELLVDFEFYKINWFRLKDEICDFFAEDDTDDALTEEQLKQWIIEE